MPSTERPVINDLKATSADYILEALAFLVLAATWGICIYYYPLIPNAVPMHFSAGGAPDTSAAKAGLFVTPAIGLILYFALTGVGQLSPNYYNFPVPITESNARTQYALARQLIRTAKLYAMLLFGYVTWAQVQAGMGTQSGLGVWTTPVTLLGTAAMIGSYFIRARRAR